MTQNEFKSFIYEGTETLLEKGDRINIEAIKRAKEPEVVFRVFRGGTLMLWNTRYGNGNKQVFRELNPNGEYKEWIERLRTFLKTDIPIRRSDIDFKHYGVTMDFIVG